MHLIDTVYQNLTPTDPVVLSFWRCVRSFSQEERAKVSLAPSLRLNSTHTVMPRISSFNSFQAVRECRWRVSPTCRACRASPSSASLLRGTKLACLPRTPASIRLVDSSRWTDVSTYTDVPSSLSQLDLSTGYASYEDLRRALLTAITEGATGFGFA